MDLAELDLKHNVLVCLPLFLPGGVLRNFFDLDLPIFCHDVLNIELQESVEASNLLRNKTMLLEIRFDHGPSIV